MPIKKLGYAVKDALRSALGYTDEWEDAIDGARLAKKRMNDAWEDGIDNDRALAYAKSMDAAKKRQSELFPKDKMGISKAMGDEYVKKVEASKAKQRGKKVIDQIAGNAANATQTGKGILAQLDELSEAIAQKANAERAKRAKGKRKKKKKKR